MRILDRLFGDVSGPTLDWHIQRQELQASIAEFCFRIAEMVLVCGAAVFVERQVGASPIASTLMSAAVAAYARSRATGGMLKLMKSHNMAPHKQRLWYWLIELSAILLFSSIVALTNTVVPLIATAQAPT